MNKVILMGRLTRDPEVRYSQGAEPKAVCRYSLAVNRPYRRDGEQEADFINIVAFGGRGEFAGKYFRKGMMVGVVGELRISSYNDKEGNRKWSTDVVVSEQHFAERRQETASPSGYTPPGAYPPAPQGFDPIQDPGPTPFDRPPEQMGMGEYDDSDLPF